MPTERYNNTTAKWVFYDANRNVVNEANIGWGELSLYFPAVSSCTAVVMVLPDATLLGAHFDKLLRAEDVDVMLDRMLEKKANRGIGQLAVIGAMSYRDSARAGFMSAPKFQGMEQLRTFAKKFGAGTGNIWSYDQGLSANKHYKAQSVGPGSIQLYYADVTFVNGNPVTFDANKTFWRQQSLTAARELI
jgi:hypothetical protein